MFGGGCSKQGIAVWGMWTRIHVSRHISGIWVLFKWGSESKRGELQALQWADVDFKCLFIKVRRGWRSGRLSETKIADVGVWIWRLNWQTA